MLKSAQSFCPIVICPGFGNCSKDYETPFDKDEALGLVSVLGRRGFDTDKIYTIPIQRLDWMNVARGIFDFQFYTGNTKADRLGYGWYLNRLKETVELAYEETTNAQKVAFHGYKVVSGAGNLIGDGIVPLEWTKLEGAKHISLEGVFHSVCNIEAKHSSKIHELNENWYGSEAVVDRWLPEIMRDLQLGRTSPSKIESMRDTAYAGIF